MGRKMRQNGNGICGLDPRRRMVLRRKGKGKETDRKSWKNGHDIQIIEIQGNPEPTEANGCGFSVSLRSTIFWSSVHPPE